MISKKKKKVFTEIETDFSAKIGNSNAFSGQKQVISKKKKVFTEIETDFSAKFGNLYAFSAQKQVISKKKRSSTKLSRIFRQKSEIQTLFRPSRHLLHNFGTQFLLGGAVFIFSPKIGLKSTKNVRFCVLYRKMEGGSSPPAPPPG